MQKLNLVLFACTIFGAGYLLGSTDSLTTSQVDAAGPNQQRLAGEALLSYKRSRLEMDKLSSILSAEEKHRLATDGENFFALSVGGIDAMRELEEGRGVDPETFAALYAGRALSEISEHVETGDDGRIRYKGNIVRLYSRERLKEMFRLRDELLNRSGTIGD